MMCIVCQRAELVDSEEQTCTRCVGRVRTTISEIVDLYALLPVELEEHAGAARPPDSFGQADSDGVPDALVLLAGGTAGTVIGGPPTLLEPDGNREHAADQWPSDVPSTLAALCWWEDDWRGPNTAQREATVVTCAGYLLDNLTRQAQQHPAFDEFAGDMFRLWDHLRVATRSGESTERGVPCPYCGSRLVRRYRDEKPCNCGPRPRQERWYGLGYDKAIYERELELWEARHVHCDQGGRRTNWICSDRECGKTFSSKRYNLAVWSEWYHRQSG